MATTRNRTKKTTIKKLQGIPLDDWHNEINRSFSKIGWAVWTLSHNNLLSETAYNKAINIKKVMNDTEKYLVGLVEKNRKKINV
ncbi:MAG: hypothetical protein IIT61_03175 [Bacteroidales bacterium]|nr:hypothetical protein [Bacteroidales bacterium]MBQ2574807.1 hypothetical protein [Bacteroidales bacterium]MBQ3875025.1 hypothetical protein [Bacteroidaceae bacterium]MBQ5423965.1 hypothetical protein [Bacteroidales bacterium]MBQ5457705.1 hypothetical protein [Bacteroidales bacterium]